MNLIGQFITSLLFAAACWGAGGLILRRWMPDEWPASIRRFIYFAAGNVIFSYLLMVLSVAGWLSWFSPKYLLDLGIVAVVVLGFIERKKRKEKLDSQPIDGLTLAGAILFALPAGLVALAPPYMRDTLVYHLAAPRAYLDAGGLVDIPGNFFFAFPKGQEMLQMLLLDAYGDRAAQLFGVWQQLAAVLGIYALISWRFDKVTALVCALGYASVPTAVYFSGGGYVEPAIALALVAAIIALVTFSKSPKPALAVLAGLFVGWLVAIKYTGLLYGGLLGLLLVVQLRKKKPGRVASLTTIFTLATLPGFFWLVRNWLVVDNPVFPFAFNFFGGAGWDGQRALAYKMYMQSYGMGRGLLDTLLLPIRLFFSGQFHSMQFDGVLDPFAFLIFVFAVVALFLSMRRKIDSPRLAGLGWATLAFAAFFVFGTQQARFFLPTHLLLCLLAAPAVELTVVEINKRRSRQAIGIIVLVLMMSIGLFETGRVLSRDQLFIYWSGDRNEAQFLRTKLQPYTAIEYINQNTPEAAKVLCAMTGNYRYYLHRKHVADSFIEDFTIKRLLDEGGDADGFFKRLTDEGYTHLLFNQRLLSKSLTQIQVRNFAAAINEHMNLLFRDGDLIVALIRQGAQGRAP